ncbi:hypothetical protein J2Y69_002628 [Microbacterium resistens]|uniref:Secreted protein n=1 Tax=Microbacterium resistens TaxID=156977 RepID=A0ABU1SEL7_9MICO|nr:hypothetical protein [Microbacterium resistens]MDR6868020.1 hypothetical protein [Microbacterium resistens]
MIRSTRRSRFAVAGALAATLLALVTACAAPGAAPGSAPDPSSAKGGAASSSKGGGDAEKEFQDWQLKFAECMRGEGIDMPDPSKDGASVTLEIPADSTAFDAASNTCQKKLGTPPSIDGKSEQEVLDEQLKTAQCLRDAGIDVEDPKPGQAMGLPMDVPEDVIKKCLTPAGN